MSAGNEILRPVLRRLVKAKKFRRIWSINDDAAAYVHALRSVGTVVPTYQMRAISNFIVAEQTAGRWSKLKRLRLHGWNLAAANAIDMASLASGTFSVSGVTHAPGYVQGNGSTGFLNTGASSGGDGLTDADFMLGVLAYTAPTGSSAATFIGAYASGSAYAQLQSYSTNQIRARINGRDYYPVLARSSQKGVLLMSRDAGYDYILRRSAAGVSYPLNTAASAAGLALSSASNYVMALNEQGSSPPNQTHNDAKLGASFVGLAMSKTDAEGFSHNLKTLWESLFGLTLP